MEICEIYSPGTILRRRLPGLVGIFAWHWGIYLGNNKVIHLNGERMLDRNASVMVDTLEVFSNSMKLHVHNRPNTLADGRRICQQARCIAETGTQNGLNGQYGFFFNNCQDFCSECYEHAGVKLECRSQTRRWIKRIWDAAIQAIDYESILRPAVILQRIVVVLGVAFVIDSLALHCGLDATTVEYGFNCVGPFLSFVSMALVYFGGPLGFLAWLV